jgi:hypothetical protein
MSAPCAGFFLQEITEGAEQGFSFHPFGFQQFALQEAADRIFNTEFAEATDNGSHGY